MGAIGSLFFFSSFISVMIFPRMADIYGRKYIFIFGLYLHTIILVCFLFIKTLSYVYLLVFIYGIAEGAKDYIAYIYLMEFMPLKY